MGCFFLSPGSQTLTFYLLHGKKGWPPSVLGFWIQNPRSSCKVTFAGHFVWCLCAQRFMFTEDAQKITFHFLDTSVFHFSSKYSKAGTNNFEIAGAESLKVHQAAEVREPELCVSHLCVVTFDSSVTLCYRNYKNITNSLCLFALSLLICVAFILNCIYF